MYPYYYRLLEVDPGASQEELRRAYRRLVKQWHPDLNRSSGAAAHFVLIQKAWQTLGDPEKRAVYDNYAKRYTHRTDETPGSRPPPPHAYQQRKTQAYSGYGGRVYYRSVDPEKLEKEEKIRRRDMVIGLVVALLIFGISSSGKVIPMVQLQFQGSDTVAEVYGQQSAVNYYFATHNDHVYGEIYPRMISVEGEEVLPGKMPLRAGDKFRIRYLKHNPDIHKIRLDQPDEMTLNSYYNLVYERWRSSSLLDSMAGNSMKSVFLYTLCDSVYDRYGIKGVANLYYATTPASVNRHSNQRTFRKMASKRKFRSFMQSIREATLP